MQAKILLLNILGFLFLVVGAAGVFVPLLPTTPFVLLATICFSYSNRRFYEWLKRSPFFGDFVVNYEEKIGIPMGLKIKSVILVWISLSISMFVIGALWAYLLLGFIGTAVSVHILMLKTRRK